MATQASQKSGVSTATLLIVVLATLGIGAPLMRSAPLPATPPPTHTINQSTVEHSALDLLEEFFDTDPDQFDAALPWSANSKPWPPPNGTLTK
jgi:hypothetical protein